MTKSFVYVLYQPIPRGVSKLTSLTRVLIGGFATIDLAQYTSCSAFTVVQDLLTRTAIGGRFLTDSSLNTRGWPAMEDIQKQLGGRFCVFGYGSLIWKPNFKYSSAKVGFISGYKRRMWQSNVTQRGTSDQPGRVATLARDSGAVVWGVAYECDGVDMIHAALEHLDEREIDHGGYCRRIIPFHAKNCSISNNNHGRCINNIKGCGGCNSEDDCDSHSDSDPDQDPTSDRGQLEKCHVAKQKADGCPGCVFPVLVYIATSQNSLYVGAGHTVYDEADDVVNSKGYCGHNIEYVLKIAIFMREQKLWDDYLFELETDIRRKVKIRRNMCLTSILNCQDLPCPDCSRNPDVHHPPE